MENVADLFEYPCTDRVPTAGEMMRQMRMQTLHAIRWPTTDRTRAFEPVMGITSRDVVGVRRVESGAEFGIASQPLVELAHAALSFEATDGLRRSPTGQPVQRGERLSVDERMRLDHGR